MAARFDILLIYPCVFAWGDAVVIYHTMTGVKNVKQQAMILLIALLSFTLVLSACRQSQALLPSSPAAEGKNTSQQRDERYVLKVGYSGSLCEAPVHMAYEQGFFADEGLEVELVLIALGTGNDAITSGQTEAGFGLLSSLMQPLSNGLPIKITTGLHTGCDKILVPKDAGISTAVELDLNILYDSAIDPPYRDQYCCAAYVRENIVEQHPEIAAKYTRAMQRASAWVAENPEEASRIQVEKNYVAGDAAQNAAILSTYNYIPSVSGAYEAFGVTAHQLQELGMLEANVDVDALHTNSFAFFHDVPDTVTAWNIKGTSRAESDDQVKNLPVTNAANWASDLQQNEKKPHHEECCE